MSVKRNALIMSGGIILLISYARLLTPPAPIPSTPSDVVKIEMLESDVAVAGSDPFAEPTTERRNLTVGSTTQSMPEAMLLLLRSSNLTVQPFNCPSGTAERDLVNPNTP